MGEVAQTRYHLAGNLLAGPAAAESFQGLRSQSAVVAGTWVDAALDLESPLAAAQYLLQTLVGTGLGSGLESLFAWDTGSQVALTPIVEPCRLSSTCTSATKDDDGGCSSRRCVQCNELEISSSINREIFFPYTNIAIISAAKSLIV